MMQLLHSQIYKEYIMSKSPIQLVACTIRPKSFLREVTLKQITFPDDWFEPLLALQAECSNRLDQPVTLPTQSLNAILQALIPQLLAAPQWVRRQSENTDEDVDSRERKRLP